MRAVSDFLRALRERVREAGAFLDFCEVGVEAAKGGFLHGRVDGGGDAQAAGVDVFFGEEFAEEVVDGL